MLQAASSEFVKRVNYVTKRDGTTKDFDKDKITQAVEKAMKSIGIRSKTLSNEITALILLT